MNLVLRYQVQMLPLKVQVMVHKPILIITLEVPNGKSLEFSIWGLQRKSSGVLFYYQLKFRGRWSA